MNTLWALPGALFLGFALGFFSIGMVNLKHVRPPEKFTSVWMSCAAPAAISIAFSVLKP